MSTDALNAYELLMINNETMEDMCGEDYSVFLPQ